MVDALLKGEKPEISDYEQYDNGTKIVGTVTSDIQLIDADNYQMLVDDGYYEEERNHAGGNCHTNADSDIGSYGDGRTGYR